MTYISKFITPGEHSLVKWQYSLLGGFMSSLWQAIAKADTGNQARLSLAFPLEVAAYMAFATVSGYWDNVQARAGLLPVGSRVNSEVLLGAKDRYLPYIAATNGTHPYFGDCFKDESNFVGAFRKEYGEIVMVDEPVMNRNVPGNVVQRWEELDDIPGVFQRVL